MHDDDDGGGGRRGKKKTKKKKRDGDRSGESGEREVASPRQLKAMRGTAVGSFLSGSVNPHAPHTHTSLFNCSVEKARVVPGGVMTEGNYGDTSPTPRGSPNNPDLPSSSCFAVRFADTTLHSSAVTTGVPHRQTAS